MVVVPSGLPLPETGRERAQRTSARGPLRRARSVRGITPPGRAEFDSPMVVVPTGLPLPENGRERAQRRGRLDLLEPWDILQVGRRQFPLARGDVFVHLLRPRCAGDDTAYCWVRQQPGEGELCHAVAARGGERFPFLQQLQVARVENAARSVRRHVREPRSFGHGAAAVLAGEKTGGERKVRQQPQSHRVDRREDLALNAPVQQAVFVLRGDRPGPPKKRIRLPVSKETGGMILPPHIDPNKTSEILEYLDSFLPPEKRR